MVLAASVKQLKRLVYLYYVQNKGAPFSSWYYPGLLNVGQALLTDHSDPDWRLYLLLCIRAWLQLYLTYPIYSDVTQAFLAMAMRNGIVPTSHANEVMACFKQAGKHHERSEQPISTFIIDFSLAPVDPQNARIGAIAETFEDMVIFDEFTTGDYVAQAEGGVTDGLDGKRKQRDTCWPLAGSSQLD